MTATSGLALEARRDVAPTGAALAALLAVATGIVRLAYEDFYRALGTTLDTVGLSSQRLLTLAVACVLVLIGAAAAVAVPARLLWGDGDDFARQVAAGLSVATAGASCTWLSKPPRLGRRWRRPPPASPQSCCR